MLKWLAWGVGAVIAIAIAAAVALPYLLDTPRVQRLVSQSATQALGRPVHFASLSISVLPLPAVRLGDLEVAEDPHFGTQPFLTIGTGSLRLRLLPLLSGRMEFSELVLDRPRISLTRDAAGRLNIASLGAGPAGATAPRPGASRGGGSAAALPIVSRVRIVDGAVTWTARSGDGAPALYKLERLNLTIEGIGPSAPVRFAGGTTIDPGGIRLTIEEGSVGIAGARSVLEAPLDARLRIDAKNLASLAARLIGPYPEVAGPVTGALAVSGTVGAPKISGELTLAKLTVSQAHAACPGRKRRTLTLEGVRAPVSFADDLFASRPFTSALAAGTITTSITLSLRDGTLHLRDIGIRGLPAGAVLVDYLCQGYAVTGPLDLTGELSARPADLWTTLNGAGQFRLGPGKVVGPQALKLLGGVLRVRGAVASILSVDLPASLFASPLDFDSIIATYTIRNGILSTDDLVYASRRMQVGAAGRYGLADGRVNASLIMKSGRGEIAAKVSGTADSPSIRVSPGALGQTPQGVARGMKDVEKGVRDLLNRLR